MNISLELIQIIDAIDRNGSFEAAANELHKVRSALTYNIRTVEDRLGVQIFDRSGHRAKLTSEGQLLLDQGRQLLNFSKQIENNVKQAASGWESVLRIAYNETLSTKALFDLSKRFQKHCPNVCLELHSTLLGGCNDAEILMHDQVDIVLGLTGPLPERSDLTFHLLGKTKFVFAVAPEHPLAKIKKTLAIDDLKKYPVIIAHNILSSSKQSSTPLLEQYYFSVTNLDLKRQTLLYGVGAGFIPYNHIKEDVKSGRLVIKQTEQIVASGSCYIAWNKAKMGKAQKWLITQLLNKAFRKKLLG